ncbi:allatotropins-like [Phlebotomus papatasi]|uniref:Allatotropin n=1 Tax=Phlebotomus papatasi TaxID=29031 RepID=A0A1B0D6R2_PHLPP|nr:allatotropins-like [Phlebotomus papatasi]XP_055705477.1 allatotropins-like [Phlebotomus papatasi]
MTSVCRMLFFVLVSAAVFLHTSHCGPARSIGLMAARAAKIPRSIRAPFRNTEMMTARGFGKRAQMIKIKDDSAPWNYGKRETHFLDEMTPENTDPFEQIVSDNSIESFPIDWFVNELVNNPILAKSILRRFVDTDKDGILTAHELLAGATVPPHQLDSNVY